MIQIIGPRLYQWDTGRSISVSNSDATHAHFANWGDSCAVKMELVDGKAKIPDYLLQTGKDLRIYLVLEGITQESDIFPVQKRERPENYVYEEDRRNYIYELITDALAATEAANQAAEDARNATQNADNAASIATEAADNAVRAAETVNDAVSYANNAAGNANEAAAKAAHTAKSLMVVGSTSGSEINLDNAIDQYLVGLRILGKTTQDGTPTPSSSVDLVNAGAGGSITVNITGEDEAQSMTIATPNGLPGIPVTSGGNYTDANGQMWHADEIDLERGVYIQRCYAETITMAYEETNNRYIGETSKNANSEVSEGIGIFVLTDKLSYNENAGKVGAQINGVRISYGNKKAVIAYYNGEEISSLDVLYPLETPIETALSEEELAAYAALHTYRGNTTVTNDASAHMELEYVMDAKKYIDSLVISGNASSRLSSVTLLASAWKTDAENLYSQVVTISGITQYSKVDLLPSVEQLAIFHNKDVAFVTENENGVVTVFAIGDKPTNDYTMQVAITEVIA